MSAVPEFTFDGDEHAPAGGGSRLPFSAMVYLFGVAALAGAVALPFALRLHNGGVGLEDWLTFATLAGGAAIAQLLLVKTPRNQSYHATNVFLVPAVLLLPPELVALLAIVQHLPAWLKNRSAWYIECFNICNYTLATLAAWGSARVVLHADGLIGNGELRFALAGCAASIVLV